MDDWDKASWPVRVGAILLVILVMAIVVSLLAKGLIWIWS